jgi:hypothetical protein
MYVVENIIYFEYYPKVNWASLCSLSSLCVSFTNLSKIPKVNSKTLKDLADWDQNFERPLGAFGSLAL